MQKIYYESQKEYLSRRERFNIIKKVLLVFLWCAYEGYATVNGWHTAASLGRLTSFMGVINSDVTGFIYHAVCFGGSLGYCVRELRYTLWGYRPRPYSDPAVVVNAKRQLEERARARTRITEIPDEPGNRTSPPSQGIPVSPEPVGQNAEHHGVSQHVTPLRPALGFIMKCFGRFALFFNNQRLELTQRQEALLAYLAVKGKGATIAKAAIKDLFYPHHEMSSLDQDKTQINKQAQKVAAGMGIGEDLSPEIVKPCQGKGTYGLIQLSGQYTLEIPPLLDFWHRTMRKMLDGKADLVITLEALRESYEPVISAYGKGFAEENLYQDSQGPDNLWDWVFALFKAYRGLQIAFLRYCAQCEEQESRRVTDPHVRRECYEYASKLYQAGALTCATFDPDIEQGEYLVQWYLRYCVLLKVRYEPQILYREYVKRLHRYKVPWEPAPETLDLLEKIAKI